MKKAQPLRVEELEARSVPAGAALSGLASIPVLGNWAGGSRTGIGVFDSATATWSLRGQASPGAPDVVAPFQYGAPGWIPVAGDWTGSGKSGIGVVDPSTMTWYLKSTPGPGAPDIAPFRYGAPGWIPMVADWNGDGKTTVGVVNPASETWYLRNRNGPGAPDITPFAYGAPGSAPVAGDWDDNGTATPGVVNPTSGTWYLRNESSAGAPDAAQPFAYGGGDWYYLAGHFTSSPAALPGGGARAGSDALIAYDPAGAVWNIRSSASAGVPDLGTFAYGSGGRPWFAALDDNTLADALSGNNSDPPTAIASFGGNGAFNNPVNGNQTPPTQGGSVAWNNPVNANQTPPTEGGNGAWNNPLNANQSVPPDDGANM